MRASLYKVIVLVWTFGEGSSGSGAFWIYFRVFWLVSDFLMLQTSHLRRWGGIWDFPFSKRSPHLRCWRGQWVFAIAKCLVVIVTSAGLDYLSICDHLVAFEVVAFANLWSPMRHLQLVYIWLFRDLILFYCILSFRLGGRRFLKEIFTHIY